MTPIKSTQARASVAIQLRDPATQSARTCGAYLGYAGYASILAATKTPATSAELSERTGVGAQNMRRLLKQFHQLRLIHRVGWVRPGIKGFDQPVYLIGDGPDVPSRPTLAGGVMPHADHQVALARRIVAFASVIQALAVPVTVDELERQSHVVRARLSDLLRHMRSAPVRLVHVAAWQPGGTRGGPPTKLYQYGLNLNDVPRPHPKPRAPRRRAAALIAQPRWTQLVTQLKRNPTNLGQRA